MKTHNYVRVLYADDNDDDRLMISIMLGFSDIKVTGANTVAEAWRLARTERFDLYLLDSRFSDGSGLDLCRRLCEHAPRTPILFYSGNAYEADKQEGLAAGANEYLVKPDFEDLAPTILRLTGRAANPKLNGRLLRPKKGNTNAGEYILFSECRISRPIPDSEL
ncbi:MAG: response regulator [Pyrinomonadaceae bacterium]